jgi:peroxiredoxin
MVLSVGDIAPDFTVRSTEREDFDLYKELEKGPILLNFYVGDFGINCTNYMAKFIESYGRFTEMGVTIVPINPDTLDSHRLWKSRMGAPFEFLFDEKQTVSNQYGAIVGPGHMVSGFTNREFFLIGKDHKIKYIWRAPAPKVLPEVDDIAEGVRKALS